MISRVKIRASRKELENAPKGMFSILSINGIGRCLYEVEISHSPTYALDTKPYTLSELNKVLFRERMLQLNERRIFGIYEDELYDDIV